MGIRASEIQNSPQQMQDLQLNILVCLSAYLTLASIGLLSHSLSSMRRRKTAPALNSFTLGMNAFLGIRLEVSTVHRCGR